MFAVAAARLGHDVDVLTRPGVDPATAVELEGAGVRLIEVGRPLGRNHNLSYLRWMVAARRRARRLHRCEAYDLGHHVTYASDSYPPAIPTKLMPVVWGPIGGSTAFPRAVARNFSVGYILREHLKRCVQGVIRMTICRRAARRARTVIVQNPYTARLYRTYARAPVVERPNVVAEPRPHTAHGGASAPMTALLVGRLIPLKGGHIAIEAISQTADWNLKIIGDGPERRRLDGLVRRRGVAGRVQFAGNLPRLEVLDAMAAADCLIFPSLGDAAGWVIAESLAAGTPVIAARIGGPEYFGARHDNVHLVDPGRELSGQVAEVLESLRQPEARLCVPTNDYSLDSLGEFLSGVYAP